MRIKRNLKWALVLSGGGAKGIAHVGVLNALLERGFPEPSLIVGTSMGAIIGGLYACGMKPAELTRFIIDDFDIAEYLDSFVFKIAGTLGKIIQTGQILGSAATKAGVDSGQRVMELLERLSGGKTFEETRIPFRCNAVDLVSGREIVFSSGPVARAIRASMSFPGFFEPLIDGDRCLVDGGLSDNMPVHIAQREGFKRVMAVAVGAFRPAVLSELKTVSKIMYRSLEVVFDIIDQRCKPAADLIIHASNGSTSLEFARKRELIALGERAVEESERAVDAFFGSGIAAYAARKRYREGGIKTGTDYAEATRA